MKPLAELDHYEVLEVSRDASPEAIERAYRLLTSAYADDSVAAYSVLEQADARALRERLEVAYRVLAEPQERHAYDESLKHEPAPVDTGLPRLPPAALPSSPAPLSATVGFEEVEGEEEDAPWDGARLRRARLVRGVELEQISKITKINPTYLAGIEDDRFEDLPAPVYVRGFVQAYARCLRLDAPRVAAAYMQHYEAQQGARSRLRGLGRR